MMVRTQINLDVHQHREAKRKAAELGISLAEYLRRLVERDLAPRRAPFDIESIIGIGSSGGSDIASDKQRYLDEASEAEAALRRL